MTERTPSDRTEPAGEPREPAAAQGERDAVAFPLAHAGLLAALVLVVAVPSLFLRDPWGPDEPRYMEAAREMVVRGDYLLPHLNGELYGHKPPVYLWLTALLWRAGLGYLASRVVTIGAVLGTLAMAYVLARRLAGGAAALLAVLTSLSTVFLVEFAKRGTPEPLLMMFETGAIVCGYAAFHASVARRRWLWCGAYACMALGTLTKGPVGLLVPALVLLCYAVLDRRSVRLDARDHLLGAALYVVLVGAWLLPAVLFGGSAYAREILLRQNVGRALGTFGKRHNPFYFYLIAAPIRLLPWSVVLPAAVLAAVRSWRREGNDALRLAVLWLVVPVAFFSLPAEKRDRYVLSIVPAAGMLLGWYMGGGASAARARVQGVLVRLAAAVSGAAALCLMGSVVVMKAAPRSLHAVLDGHPGLGREVALWWTAGRMAFALALLCVPLGCALAAALVRGRTPRWRAYAVVCSAVPLLNRFKSGRFFGERVARVVPPQATIYQFRSAFSGAWNLFARRTRMPIINTRAELLRVLGRRGVFVIGESAALRHALGRREVDRRRVLSSQPRHRMMLLLKGGPAP